MNNLIIDTLGIKEEILSINQRFQSVNNFGTKILHNTEFDITINHSDLILYKFINFVNNYNTSNKPIDCKLPMVFIGLNNQRFYRLHNVIINNLEYTSENFINFTLISDFFEIITEDDIREIEVSLRKDKIKKILSRIKYEFER